MFAHWGVKVGFSFSQSVIASVSMNNARRKLSKAVEEATAGNCDHVGDAIEEVEACLAVLKDMQKDGVSA